jgi:hypothetical protein
MDGAVGRLFYTLVYILGGWLKGCTALARSKAAQRNSQNRGFEINMSINYWREFAQILRLKMNIAI